MLNYSDAKRLIKRKRQDKLIAFSFGLVILSLTVFVGIFIWLSLK